MIEMRWFKEADAEPVLQYRFKQYKVVKGESAVNGIEVTMSEWATVPLVEAA